MIARLTAAVLLAWLAWPAPAGAEKRYAADRFDVVLALDRDGSLQVTESVTFRFEGGSFTEVFRRIPRRRTDGVSGITGTIDGQMWPPPDGEGRFRIDREDGLQAIWRFPAVRDATRTFGLRYVARGVVERQAESDVFTWFVLPTDHEYRIAESRVRVEWPAGARPLGEPLVTPAGAEVVVGAGGFEVVARHLGPDDAFRVTVRFETGSLVAAMPAWQARQVRGRELAPSVLAVAGLILAAGLAALFVFWNGHRRQALPVQSGLPMGAAPGDLPPAVAAVLANPATGVTLYGFFGVVFDLARRGALRMEAASDRRWSRSKAFDLVRADRASGLRPHEQLTLDLLFAPKKGPRDRVRLSEVAKAAHAGWSRFKKTVVEEMMAAGLVSPDRRRTRGRVLGVGFGILAVGGLLFVPAGILTDRFSEWPLVVPAAVELLGIAVLIVGASFSTLTDEGRHASAGWKAYARHLRDVSRRKAALPDAGAFAAALAFATAAGFGSAWVKVFAKSGRLADAPSWFHAAAAADAAGQLEAFVAMIGGVHAAGHSGSGSAGAGAGGGGASGAH